MALYEDSVMRDLIAAARPLLDKGQVFINKKHEFEITKEVVACATPWIIIRPAMDRVCGKWFPIYWERYQFISKGCRGCWKIVAKVNTLEELWKVYKLQQKLYLPSKCGMDRREWTPSIWSAFWYCPIEGGLDGARALWKRINKAVQEEVGDVKVILKRA